MNTLEIRQHPAGGLTVAVPVPGTLTAKVYVGRYAEAEHAAAGLTLMEAVYARRRTWSKTDTERWLNDKACEQVLRLGYQLRQKQPKKFERAHARLVAAGSDEQREAMALEEVL